MNVIALSQRCFGMNLVDGIFGLRRCLFRERLGWSGSVGGDRELGLYDALNPTYPVPTTASTMLANTLAKLLNEPAPARSRWILKSIRFCVDACLSTEPVSNGLARAIFLLFAEMIESLRLLNADSIVTVTNTRMERDLRRAGWRLERVDAPQRIGEMPSLDVFMHGSSEALANTPHQAGLEGPVLSPAAIISHRRLVAGSFRMEIGRTDAGGPTA